MTLNFRTGLLALLLVSSVGALAKEKKAAPEQPVGDPAGTPKKSKPLPAVPSGSPALAPSNTVTAARPVEMKLLILATDGTEPGLEALKFFLDRLGTPYQVALLANGQPLPQLDDGYKGNYQGIILTSGNLEGKLAADGWAKLDTYARDYKVRMVSYYTWPEARYGIAPAGSVVTSNTSPANITFETAAASVFPYLRRTQPVKVENAYMYLALPAPAAGETTTSILKYNTTTVGVLHKKADGREYMALMMDNYSALFHSKLLNYGVFNWVTKGIFLGVRKAYLSPQSDDLFLASDLFDVRDPACIPVGFTTEPTYDPGDKCPTVKTSGDDLDTLSLWQDTKNKTPQFADFKLAFAYNGFGTTTAGGAAKGDALVQSAKDNKDTFYWVNHTYNHEDLDCYNPVPNSRVCAMATYDQSVYEIKQNFSTASSLRLVTDKLSMVTPGISGLKNAEFLRAAKAQGIRYLVGDLSRPDHQPASPNTGIRSPLEPSILIIPRRATNIFYNVASGRSSVPGSEPDEYNYFYGPNGIFRIGGPGGPPFFSTNQSYSQITSRESDLLVGYMLSHEVYPVMFHQANHYRYSGKLTLFTDVMDATFTKFAALTNLPVISLQQTDVGKLLEARTAYNASGVRAVLTPGVSIQITTVGAATIPVTGICGDGCETYGLEKFSYIPMGANGSKTINPF